jgi:hypothetical protein
MRGDNVLVKIFGASYADDCWEGVVRGELHTSNPGIRSRYLLIHHFPE